jgi:hypothetical protein
MASTNIQRTLGQNSNSGKLTISVWVKRAGFGEQGICGSWYSGAYHGILYFNSNDQITFYDYRNSYIMRKITTAQFRDVGAWYHIVCNFDHTLGSPTGKIYVNGVEQTLSTDINYTQGATSSWLTDYPFNIGSYDGSSNYFNGNMSDFYFIQGYVYEASTFGETDATTGIWKPITEPTVNYSSTGNNSCHLKFENLANMDLDSGDNNVSFTTTGNLTQTVDTPSNVFATLNPLMLYPGNTVLANGNTSCSTASGYSHAYSTLAVSTGKWYWEGKLLSSENNYFNIGIMDVSSPIISTTAYPLDTSNAYLYAVDGNIYQSGSSVLLNTGTTISVNDIVGFYLDLDNGTLKLQKNGSNVYSGNAVITGLSSDITWCVAHGAAPSSVQFNFGNGYFGTTAVSSANNDAGGQGIFEYSPTLSGVNYYALNTKNINTYG